MLNTFRNCSKSNLDIRHLQLSLNIHTAHHRTGHRTLIDMKAKHFFSNFPLFGLCLQVIGDVDAFNDENIAVLLNLAADF